MPTLITDRELERKLLADRVAFGADRFDEVWEGVYVMAPMPNEEHQDIVALLTAIFVEMVRRPGLGKVMPGVNLSDREKDWQQNFRVPDIAVLLSEGKARNLGTHWCGGADLIVEIVSSGDHGEAPGLLKNGKFGPGL